MTTHLRLTIAALLPVCLAGVLLADSTAWAQDASAWDTQPHTAARLMAGALVKTPGEQFLRAGIEITLAPGWKTYWRDPGDSGAPPTFDFSGSGNVKSATVSWPAPEKFPDGAGGNSIGYVGDVVLPLRVAPQDAAKPALLKLKLGYAICGTLCVPVEADLKLALDGNGGQDAAIARAEGRVPRRVPLGAKSGSGLAILAVHREPAEGLGRVVVDVAAPAGAPVDLFVEGPTPDWSLPLPEPTGGDGAQRQFSFALDGLPADAKPDGATLIVTAVSGDDAIEVLAHLD